MNSILFELLCICFIFYLYLGFYSYKVDKKSKVSSIFLALCISTSLWALGFAFMLISPNIEIANLWRLVASLGWCFFNGLFLEFAFSLKNPNEKNFSIKLRSLLYIPSILFFINTLIRQPSEIVIRQYYGWVDIYGTTIMGTIYAIYCAVTFIASLLIIFLWGKYSNKNRNKKQMKIILITSFISFSLVSITDLILPAMGIIVFSSGIISVSISMGGMWYAIIKHRMMSISPEFVSEYIYKAVNEPIIILSEDFVVKHCNEACLNITGYNYKEMEQKSLEVLINSRDLNLNAVIKEGHVSNIEVDVQRKNVEPIVCELTGTVIYDEYKDILGIVILLHDVSEKKNAIKIQQRYNLELKYKISERTSKLQESNLILKNEIRDRILAENQIRHFVYHDALTGLPNRKNMLENVDILLVNKNKKFAVFFIDLDNFKNINDNFGHQAGDTILKIVAERLKSIIRSSDTICRIGGDEFIIILKDFRSSANFERIAIDIGKILSVAITYKETHLFIGASIGISIFPEHGTDVDTLIRNADLAMYEVKHNGGYGYDIYSAEMSNKAIDKLTMKIKLNKAVLNNEFIGYYQPIINLKTMKVLSAESLIRWKLEDVIIPPLEFISIAKNVGEIVAIDNWMLENACIQCKKWHDLGAEEFCIAVNTSYKQLIQVNFVELVINILHKHSLSPKYLNLEITEEDAMEDFESIINILKKLKSFGIKISLDDFGTGYSSLSYVNKLPINILKIDRSLITNLEEGSKNIVIINLIIMMAHSLNIKVVAEGIETKAQFNILNELQCDLIQGYLIGKPVDASDFEEKFIKSSLIDAFALPFITAI